MEFLKTLLPREDKFFALMRALSDQAHDSAALLKTYIEGKDKAAGKKLAESKVEAKRLMEQLTREVALSFITPFDREDIQEFGNHLYKIVKTADKIRERLALHSLDNAKGDFTRQMDLIVAEAEVMQEIVEALTHKGAAKVIVEKVAMLHDLENDGDVALGQLLVHLFENTADTRALILRKDIYDMLEKVLDRYRDAAAIALQIVLKHS